MFSNFSSSQIKSTTPKRRIIADGSNAFIFDAGGFSFGGGISNRDIRKFRFVTEVNSLSFALTTYDISGEYPGYSSTTHAYVDQGNIANASNKVSFSTHTVSSITQLSKNGNLSSIYSGNQSSTHGYIGGGYETSPNGYSRYLNKRAFSNDTISFNSTWNASGWGYAGKASGPNIHTGSPDRGYMWSGYPGYSDRESLKITFSNDSRSTLGTNVTLPTLGIGGFSSPTHGYPIGGGSNNRGKKVDKFAFSNDTRTQLTDLTFDFTNSCGMESSNGNGYMLTGNGLNCIKYNYSADTFSYFTTTLGATAGSHATQYA